MVFHTVLLIDGPKTLGPRCAITLEETRPDVSPLQAHYGIYRTPTIAYLKPHG